jgi:hypothetical protein
MRHGLFNDERVALASTPVAHDAHHPELSPQDRALGYAPYVVFGQPRSLSEAAKAGPVLVRVDVVPYPRQDALDAPLRRRRLWRAWEIGIAPNRWDDLDPGSGLA